MPLVESCGAARRAGPDRRLTVVISSPPPCRVLRLLLRPSARSRLRSRGTAVALQAERARTFERNVEDALHASRPRAHHRDAIGEIDRFVDLMGDEQHRLSRLRSRSSAARPACTRASARRARRTARPSAAPPDRRQRPRQIDALLHAAGELRRIVLLEAGQADQLDERVRALAASSPRRSASASPCRSGRCRRWCATAAGWNAERPRRDRRRGRRRVLPSMAPCPSS